MATRTITGVIRSLIEVEYGAFTLLIEFENNKLIGVIRPVMGKDCNPKLFYNDFGGKDIVLRDWSLGKKIMVSVSPCPPNANVLANDIQVSYMRLLE